MNLLYSLNNKSFVKYWCSYIYYSSLFHSLLLLVVINCSLQRKLKSNSIFFLLCELIIFLLTGNDSFRIAFIIVVRAFVLRNVKNAQSLLNCLLRFDFEYFIIIKSITSFSNCFNFALHFLLLFHTIFSGKFIQSEYKFHVSVYFKYLGFYICIFCLRIKISNVFESMEEF